MNWVAYGFYVVVAVLILYADLRIREYRTRTRQKECELGTRHALQIHKHDKNGEVLHTCQCGAEIEWGLTPQWCRICADPELEQQSRRYDEQLAAEAFHRVHDERF